MLARMQRPSAVWHAISGTYSPYRLKCSPPVFQTVCGRLAKPHIFYRAKSSTILADEEAPYTTEPILPHFGIFVRNFSLAGDGPLPQKTVDRIKDDMRKHRVLVFKDQGLISGERQYQISAQLGELESTFYQHPASPHRHIFRVSNNEQEGCTHVGRTGWHVDGTFQAQPFKYQTMHFHSVCEGGETWFIPLKEFYEMQNEETKARWDRLWFVTGKRGYTHPLVYRHPVRGDATMLFHCGEPFCAAWAVDDDAEDTTKRRPQYLVRKERVQDELTALLDSAVDTIGIKMNWEVGDFAINDNVGNCHYAPPGTQTPAQKAGLRILHRTTIAGESVPTKFDGRQSYLLNF